VVRFYRPPRWLPWATPVGLRLEGATFFVVGSDFGAKRDNKCIEKSKKNRTKIPPWRDKSCAKEIPGSITLEHFRDFAF
jgi:hypothetical protein